MEGIARKESQLEIAITRCGTHANALEEVVNSLESSLSPVLRAEVPEKPTVEKEQEEPTTQRAAEIEANSKSISRSTTHIRSIINRLEC